MWLKYRGNIQKKRNFSWVWDLIFGENLKVYCYVIFFFISFK